MLKKNSLYKDSRKRRKRGNKKITKKEKACRPTPITNHMQPSLTARQTTPTTRNSKFTTLLTTSSPTQPRRKPSKDLLSCSNYRKSSTS